MTTRAEHRQAARAAARTPNVKHEGSSRAGRRSMVFGRHRVMAGRAVHLLPRDMRRNLHGRGRWRRALTENTGRYAEPFATNLGD